MFKSALCSRMWVTGLDIVARYTNILHYSTVGLNALQHSVMQSFLILVIYTHELLLMHSDMCIKSHLNRLAFYSHYNLWLLMLVMAFLRSRIGCVAALAVINGWSNSVSSFFICGLFFPSFCSSWRNSFVIFVGCITFPNIQMWRCWTSPSLQALWDKTERQGCLLSSCQTPPQGME